MTRLINTAFAYMILGLVSGVFYREYTKLTDNLTTESPLSTVHTHLLALGMLMFLIVAALDGLLTLRGRRSFEIFYWTYNVGLIWTVVMMVVRGMFTLNGHDPATTSAAIPGMAGLGHVILTIALVFLFIALRAGAKERAAATQTASANHDSEAV